MKVFPSRLSALTEMRGNIIADFFWDIEMCCQHLHKVITDDAPALLLRDIKNQRLILFVDPKNMDLLIVQPWTLAFNVPRRVFDITSEADLKSAIETSHKWTSHTDDSRTKLAPRSSKSSHQAHEKEGPKH